MEEHEEHGGHDEHGHGEHGGPKPCVFCAITSKKIHSKIVHEDDYTVAFLDINPRSTGMTIVAPKKHYATFNEDTIASERTFSFAQTVGMMIRRALNPKAIDFAIIPSQEVPHFHIRIYPVSEGETPLMEGQPKHVGEEELEELAGRIRAERPVEEIKEHEHKQAEQPNVSEEDMDFIKRELGIA
ncbi:HIT domain-containing protein [archaeon]|nr:MAG: HIT domain-containing protein [archaeon]